MARTRTLTNLIADVRAASDTENDQHVTDAQITEFVNQGIAELYDLLVDARGHEYYAASTPLSLVVGTELYAIPTTMHELIKVDISVNGTNWDMIPYSFHERNDYNQTFWGSTYPIVYRVIGQQLSFLPIPKTAYTVTLWYIPHCTRLTQGSDTFDGINGWEEMVVWRSAAMVLAKEESDPSFALQMVARIQERIQRLADKRNAYGSEKVRDVYGNLYAWRPWRRLPMP